MANGSVANGGPPSVDPERPGVRFSVRDRGPGIAPENLGRVFERFWQERSTAHRGAGLGLAIAKAIAQAHGGCVWAERTPGEGSTFHLYLPASDACNDAESEAQTAHSK